MYKISAYIEEKQAHAAAADIINNNPIQFIPTYYYGKNGVLLLNQTKFKYLTTVLDGILFYFRNDKGESTCLPCNFSKSRRTIVVGHVYMSNAVKNLFPTLISR